MEVQPQTGGLDAAFVMKTLMEDAGAVTDHRVLQDSLPSRLARLLQCRCVLIYQRMGETLQLLSGSYVDKPGWSSELLAVAHINPIALNGDTWEAQAWQQRRAITNAIHAEQPTTIVVPLLYRTRGIGVLVAMRGEHSTVHGSWTREEILVVEAVAGVAAMLLENRLLLEKNRERIHELSLLNSMSRQFRASWYDAERLRSSIIQRAKEISLADLCDCIFPSTPPGAVAWIAPALQSLLLQDLSQQAESNLEPLVIERPGNARTTKYLSYLDVSVKTFFAIPLWNGHNQAHAVSLVPTLLQSDTRTSAADTIAHAPELQGIIVGAFHQPRKLRREEITLLTILANQASAAMANQALMNDVVEARNEARKLLHQVVDDQRMKELILESIPSGLLSTDLQGRVLTSNRAAADILEYADSEITGHYVQTMLALRNFHLVIETEKPTRETVTMIDAQGSERIVETELLPFRNDQGKLIGALVTLTDMTIMHRLEEEKRRLDRLASLGEMAANVAHEVRNPLASIKTSMQLLLEDLRESQAEQGQVKTMAVQVGEEMQETATVVLKEVERLDAIVRDMLLFARPRQLHRVTTSIVETCERVLGLIASQFEEGRVIIHRVYHGLPVLHVDVVQIEQVLLNLLLNALQAMPGGGILTISLQQSGSSWLEVKFSDTGTGIAAEQLERIFQPFFTTKAHGIGLGLSISRRLVEDHGGQLLVESQPGLGATFTIRLPGEESERGRYSDDEEQENDERVG